MGRNNICITEKNKMKKFLFIFYCLFFLSSVAQAQNNSSSPIIERNLISLGDVNFGETINTNVSISNPESRYTLSIVINNLESNVKIIEGQENYSLSISSIDIGSLGSYEYTISIQDDLSGNLIDTYTNSLNIVDNQAPTIILNSFNPQIVTDGTYVDSGSIATDNYDGDLTTSIITTNTVDPVVPGVYIVSYDVIDSSGNSALTTRTVNVVGTDESIFESLLDWLTFWN